MSTLGGILPRWLVVLGAQLLAVVLILHIYLLRSRSMEETEVPVVSFERLGQTDYHEAEVKVHCPGKAEVNIRSSAGSGGYAMMALDVWKNEGTKPAQSEVTASPALTGGNMQERLEQPVEKHGVRAERPTIKDVVKRPGAPQLYTGTIEVKEPGSYTVAFVQMRPWEAAGHKIFYVVHVQAS